jgi:hypothetical protein
MMREEGLVVLVFADMMFACLHSAVFGHWSFSLCISRYLARLLDRSSRVLHMS